MKSVDTTLPQQVGTFARRHLPVLRGRVLLAVSGGVDSMVMLDVLTGLARDGQLAIEPVVGHINHHLRPEADAEEAFVRKAAADYGLVCLSRSVDVRRTAAERRLSVETAGRYLRIDGLVDMAREAGCAAVATAHHLDDNIETVLFRLRRGTGYRGLAGIRPWVAWSNGSTPSDRPDSGSCVFVRPMLSLRRGQIAAYAHRHSLSWCEDASNRSRRFARNRIRHELLPALVRSCGADLQAKIGALADAAGRLVDRIEREADRIWPAMVQTCGTNRLALDRQTLADSPPLVQAELLRRAFGNVGLGLGGLTSRHYATLMDRIGRLGWSGRLDMPGGGHFECRDGQIIVAGGDSLQGGDAEAVRPMGIELVPGQAVEVGPWRIESALRRVDGAAMGDFVATKDRFVEWIDAHRLRGPLRVRGRRPGDRFEPLGLAGSKRVGKFLARPDVPAELRRRVCIVEDDAGIVWVAPVRLDRRCCVTALPCRVLELRLTAATAPN